tara:strand:- start:90 stop:647 length:558 start_codon:yes stop_codon:yes gene_type:complete
MRTNKFLFSIIFLTFCYFTPLGNAQENNTIDIAEAFKPNWPYKAFLAIPRISEIKPMIVVKVGNSMEFVEPVKCIEVEYYEIEKKFNPRLLLDRDSLHRLLCKAMIRAVLKTKVAPLPIQVQPGQEIGLRFNFYEGQIFIVEVPYPPVDPLVLLEDLFVDGIEDIKFGDLDIPLEYDPEIKETPL